MVHIIHAYLLTCIYIPGYYAHMYMYIYTWNFKRAHISVFAHFSVERAFSGKTSVNLGNERFLGNAHILNIAMGQNSHLALLGCPLCPMARSPRALPIPNPTTLSQVCVFAHRRYSCDGLKLKNMRRQPRGGSAKMACLKQKTIGACLHSLHV